MNLDALQRAVENGRFIICRGEDQKRVEVRGVSARHPIAFGSHRHLEEAFRHANIALLCGFKKWPQLYDCDEGILADCPDGGDEPTRMDALLGRDISIGITWYHRMVRIQR